ncbi:hypothetical protein CROQUDRAFT_662289 [Cronartium quercuum f. sp. fusiforme G11]|uniref:HTH La-type RNA-binding domain-containing protein n=1 Tax=Cronartium quercuum f. sp. fusiforme G11 TaxID=708437 RepID=A0A9P6N9V0_9BASI|nr:hypothetical protein CROQUDRAFT_662289 [Cronartium quercuum f. sp. fusiforme G11]
MSFQSWADRARASLISDPLPTQSQTHSVSKSTTIATTITTTTNSHTSTAIHTPCLTSTAPSTPASSNQEPHPVPSLNQGSNDDLLNATPQHSTQAPTNRPAKLNGHPPLSNPLQSLPKPPTTDHSASKATFSANKTAPTATGINVWQARKEELSKRYQHSGPHLSSSSRTDSSLHSALPSPGKLDKGHVKEIVPKTASALSPQLPALPLIVDTASWPAPSEEVRSASSSIRTKPVVTSNELTPDQPTSTVSTVEPKLESGPKTAGGKKIQWKPIKADITHNAPLPTNHPASVRAQRSNKKDSTGPRPSQPAKPQPSLNNGSTKSSKPPVVADEGLSCIVDRTLVEEIDKMRIRSELTRQIPRPADHPPSEVDPVYRDGLVGSLDLPGSIDCGSPISQAREFHQTLGTSAPFSVLANSHPTSAGTPPVAPTAPAPKPGFIPRISPTIQPPTMELSAGPTEPYMGIPVSFSLCEPPIAHSTGAAASGYDLHVNAPQGNVWVNDPLVMSDGSSPVVVASESSTHSAAMILDGYRLDRPGSDSGSAFGASAPGPNGVKVDHALAEGVVPNVNQLGESGNGLPTMTNSNGIPPIEGGQQAGEQIGTRKGWRAMPMSGYEDGREMRVRKGSSTRTSPPSARGPTKDGRSATNPRFTSVDDFTSISRSNTSHSHSSSHGPSMSNQPWKASSPRKQSVAGKNGRVNGSTNGNGSGKNGSKSNSWRSSSNGTTGSSTGYKPRGYSSLERNGRGSVSGSRAAEEAHNWYTQPQPPYVYPAPHTYSPTYGFPPVVHDPHSPSLYNTPPYVSHPDSPGSNPTPTLTSPHLPMVYGSAHTTPNGCYPSLSQAFPAHPSHLSHASPIAVDQAYHDPSVYYGLHHPYYPTPSQSSSASRSSSIHSPPLPDLPPKPSFAVFGNYDRPAPMLAYPYPLDPVQYYVLGQCEYYFSVENLVKDVFLRSHMEQEGWVKISTISSFNRIKSLSTDLEQIRDVMALSAFLEVDRERMMVRKKSDWADWLLPILPMEPYSTNTNGPSLEQPLVSEIDEKGAEASELAEGSTSISQEGPVVAAAVVVAESEGSEPVEDLKKSFDPVITVSPRRGQPTISIGFDPSLSRPRPSNRTSSGSNKRSTMS